MPEMIYSIILYILIRIIYSITLLIFKYHFNNNWRIYYLFVYLYNFGFIIIMLDSQFLKKKFFRVQCINECNYRNR